ncbi:MAG: hypothetical protein LCH67_08595 [Bacteroidetes bacterium]|nr:hypothetical protein [Bacteroidota bacterium]
MSFRIELSSNFEKQLKKLLKKYPSIKSDVFELGKLLSKNPLTGTPLGRNCYKIRLAISSKGKGKSSGARVITHIKIINETIYLLSIYDKSEKDSLMESEIDILLKEVSE